MIVIREPQSFYFDFDLPKKVDENLKHAIKFFIKNNESFAVNKIKNEIEQLLRKNKSMETIFMNTENSKTNELHKFVLLTKTRLKMLE